MNHMTDFELNEYFDETLDASARREADSHLQSCTECRVRLEALQQVFSDLAELNEIKMPRDLTSSVMARLPQKQSHIWTPSFAAQLGAVLGLLLWLSTQAGGFVTGISFRLPAFVFQLFVFNFQPPAIEFSTILKTILQPSAFSLQPLTLNLQPFNIPTLNLQLSTINLVFIAVSVFALWIVGNLSLLRDRSEAQK